MDYSHIILVAFMILFASTTAFLAVYLHLYESNIRHLSKQLDFILKNETNLKIYTSLHEREICRLISLINTDLEQQRLVARKLIRNNKVFRESITSLSHDLRTPLTSAGGYIQMLNEQNLSEEKRLEYGTLVENRMKTVANLIDQLFTYARIEAEELELASDRVNLTNLLCDVISLYYNDFTSKKCEPEIDLPDHSCYTLGDKDAITRIFSNIIYNSLVHGIDHYHISLCENASSYEFICSNSCTTIKQEDLDHLFDRFYTTDHSRSKKTTGLGLAIAKRLVIKMKGTISADLNRHTFSIRVNFKKYK